jgi:hypothetical protein
VLGDTEYTFKTRESALKRYLWLQGHGDSKGSIFGFINCSSQHFLVNITLRALQQKLEEVLAIIALAPEDQLPRHSAGGLNDALKGIY